MTSPSKRLYFVRHGITAWNRDLRFQGHTDVPLAPEGQDQAERIGARLAAIPTPPQAVWASDLSRARETAEAIARPLGLTVQITPLLKEFGMGVWEGLNRQEIEARGEAELLAAYFRDPHTNRPPEAESLQAAGERLLQALETIQQQAEGPVAIVGHGGSMRVLICAASGIAMESWRQFQLENASLSITEEREAPGGRIRRLLLLNDVSHL